MGNKPTTIEHNESNWPKIFKSTKYTFILNHDNGLWEVNRNDECEPADEYKTSMTKQESCPDDAIIYIGHDATSTNNHWSYDELKQLRSHPSSKELEYNHDMDLFAISGYKFEIIGDLSSNKLLINGDVSTNNLQAFLLNNTIQKICANVSGQCIFFITDKQQVYGIGTNSAGQLGFGRRVCAVPIRIQSLSDLGDIVDIQQTLTNSVALCGVSKNISKLIISYWNRPINIVIPDDIIELMTKFIGRGRVYVASAGWKEQNELRDEDIMKIRAGSNHCLFLDIKGRIRCIGGNCHGQLGIGHNNDRYTINCEYFDYSQITTDYIGYFVQNKIRIKDIECGFDHNLAIDINGKVYSWGYDNYYQCGHGNKKHDTKNKYFVQPKMIEAFTNYVIMEIKCGSHHSYCKSVDYKHFLFGSNEYNECIGSNKHKLPYCINHVMNNLCENKNIKSVSLGFKNTVFVMLPTCR